MTLIGKTIDRYRILEQQGQGGMAVVYKAYDTRLERDVAIKVIRVGEFPESQRERLLQRFEREAKAQARFDHPNIVPVLDYGEFESAPFLVMKMISGGTLKARTGRPMPIAEAAALLAPIADALAYAHARKILHRDVKPSNILIDEQGTPFLTDFGIAKLIEAEEGYTLTGTGMGVGTPEYMAPEQWKGQAGPQTDIYSLGVVLYELVTGRKPYTADTPAAVGIMQATEPLPLPRQFVADLPEAAEKIMLKALAFRPEDRYESMAAFGVLLDELARIVPVVGPTGISPALTTPQPETRDELTAGVSDKKRTVEPATQDELIDIRAANPISASPPRKAGLPKGVAVAGGLGLLVLVALLVTNSLLIDGDELFDGADRSFNPGHGEGVGSATVNPVDGARLFYIPAGEFLMGSNSGESDEQPLHTVFLNAYWMYETEVTNAQYAQFVAETGHANLGSSTESQLSQHPVVSVTWADAVAYCDWAGVRLPSEAEWEKAARGTDARTYPWGNTWNSRLANATGDADGFAQTAPVGSFPDGASPYGLLDMAGNVWEWVADGYDSDYYVNSPESNPQGVVNSQYHILRGGSWNFDEYYLRTTFRFANNPSNVFDFFGFRCASSTGD